MVEDYTVKLDAFEGPMDLLMHLIEKNKIDIYDIPIACLTDQYMQYLKCFKEFNIEVASEFLVMAATLLQIKSRILLPKQPKAIAEEDGEDPRQELIERLLEYRRFKEVSGILDDLAEKQGKYFYREPSCLPIHHLPPENVSVNLLIEAFRTVLAANEEVETISIVRREHYSVRNKMKYIKDLIEAGGCVLFTDAFVQAGTKEELITTFLALLELMKLKKVIIRQEQSFAPIYLYARNGET